MARDHLVREFKNIRFDLFLDRKTVMSAVDKKARRVLARTGGYTKVVVQRSMRKAGKPARIGARGQVVGGQAHTSKPGQPPRWHTRKLKDNIYFFYDMKQREVVIGPLPFKNTPTVKPSTPSGAALLEFGGGASVVRRGKSRKRGTKRRVVFKARPFMAPAIPPINVKNPSSISVYPKFL